MRKSLLFLAFAISFMSRTSGIAQENFTISGYIEDVDSGEKLIAANVFEEITALGTVSNTYGFYSLTIPSGKRKITYSYIGYQSQEIKVELIEDINLNIELSSTLDLETIEVVAERVEKIEERSQMSQIAVPIEAIRKVPVLFAEVDV